MGVLKCNGNLTGHALERIYGLFIESVFIGGLHIQSAEDAFAND